MERSPQTPDLAQGMGVPFGRYRLLQKLGEGGMATVYLAEMSGVSGFSKRVALKLVKSVPFMPPEFNQWFISEARLGGYLSHPNIVETLDFGEQERGLFLAMEYMDGPSLEKVIELHRAARLPIPVDICLQMMIEALMGLHHAHEARDHAGRHLQLVHRDVKPSNMLLNRHGELKIADFGVARASSNIVHTQVTGAIKGTAQYMSPEQAWGLKELDRRSDVFSVGLILFELLALETFYQGSSVEMLLRRAQDAELDPRLALLPPGPLTPQITQLLRRALAREPADRFQTAVEMARALRELYQQIPGKVDLRTWFADAFEPTFLDMGEGGSIRDTVTSRAEQFTLAGGDRRLIEDPLPDVRHSVWALTGHQIVRGRDVETTEVTRRAPSLPPLDPTQDGRSGMDEPLPRKAATPRAHSGPRPPAPPPTLGVDADASSLPPDPEVLATAATELKAPVAGRHLLDIPPPVRPTALPDPRELDTSAGELTPSHPLGVEPPVRGPEDVIEPAALAAGAAHPSPALVTPEAVPLPPADTSDAMVVEAPEEILPAPAAASPAPQPEAPDPAPAPLPLGTSPAPAAPLRAAPTRSGRARGVIAVAAAALVAVGLWQSGALEQGPGGQGSTPAAPALRGAAPLPASPQKAPPPAVSPAEPAPAATPRLEAAAPPAAAQTVDVVEPPVVRQPTPVPPAERQRRAVRPTPKVEASVVAAAPAPARGKLKLNARPTATVKVNGISIGSTSEGAQIYEASAGLVKLEYVKESEDNKGASTLTHTLEIARDQELTCVAYFEPGKVECRPTR